MMEARWGRGSGIGKWPCWDERHRRELKLNNEAKNGAFHQPS